MISYVVFAVLIVPAVWLCDWILPGFHTNELGRPIATVLGWVGVAVLEQRGLG